MFVNDPGGRDSISGRVILKTEKIVLEVVLLNTQHYKLRLKGKVEQGVLVFPTFRCSSFWKRNLRVALDFSRQHLYKYMKFTPKEHYWEWIFNYCGPFCPHLGSFFVLFFCFFFHYVSAKFHIWPSLGDLPRPRIGILSLVTVSPVITVFHSWCLSHHVFDQVNLWPAWVGFETAIFWQCSPGTV